MKKIVVLYHKNCRDGFGAAWAAWKKFGARAEYIGVNHGELLPRNLKGKEVYILDFSYPPVTMKKLLKTASKVISIDHHISAEKSTKMAYKYVYELGNCGCFSQPYQCSLQREFC